MENKNIGKVPNRVAQLRKEYNLSQEELGERVYVDRRTISHIENGFCTFSNLVMIADYFGVSLDYITMRSGERDIPLNKFESIDEHILAQIKEMTLTEKEKLLKHLRLEKALRIKYGE